MKNLKSNGVILDRLSKLPDSLILEILSLLKMRDAVRTSLLSKRWKDLWFTIPCLKFQNFMNDLVKSRFFVYRYLMLWRGGHLREFSIDFSTDSEPAASLSMDMALWVQFATEKKVQDLNVQYYSNITGQLCLPQCLYECSSLRKLSLYDCNLQIRGNVKWYRLNSLKLSDCVFSEDVMNQVLSSSPQLQDFTIRCCFQRFQNLSIRSSSLKKLCIIRYLDDDPSVLTIWAPNLQVLTYSGTPRTKFLLTDISSLTEVQLTDSCFQVLRGIEGNESFSPLSNVKLLTVGSWSIENSDIVGLLDIFPKLKMLIINWKYVGQHFQFDAENYTESEVNIPKSNFLHLRTVVITCETSSYNTSLFEFIGFLLKHATMIEKMTIRRKGVFNSEEIFEAAQNLLRSFPSIELLLC